MTKTTLKQRILDNAILLFQQNGYHRVTVDQIVEETGTSKGGFYHNYQSKDELLYQIHDIFISYVIKKAQEAYDDCETPVSRLCAILYSFTKVFDLYKSHITVFYQESMYVPNEYKDIINEKRDQYRIILEKVIQEGQQTGDFRKEVPANISTMAIIGMVNWTYKWFNQQGPMAMEQITEVFTDMVLHALTTERGLEEARAFNQLL